MAGAGASEVASDGGLLGGLLSRFTELVGEGPGYATFHFASQQEGARLGEGSHPADLPELLLRVDAILGQRSRLLEATTGLVRLQVDGSSLLRAAGRTGSGVVLGFWEGVLKAVFKHPFDGEVEGLAPAAGTVILAFKGRASA